MKSCTDCKNFICTYQYGFAKEDSGYIEVCCKKKTQSRYGYDNIWDITNDCFTTEEFLNCIKKGQECKFYAIRKEAINE